MFIGIDASRAFDSSPTGTETYSRELLRALLTLDRSNYYRLYTRGAVSPDALRVDGNFEVWSIPFPRLWTHVRLSAAMLWDPPQLLFVPAHVLPIIHPRKTIVTVHDLGHLYFPQAHPLLQRLYHTWATNWNAKCATAVLADSEATQRDLVQYCGISANKIRVVYPAYDSALYRQVRDAARIAKVCGQYCIEGEYILAVGTLHPRKNYVRLVQAFAQLERADELVIVGKRGWMFQAIFQEVERLGLQSRVHFLDYVPPADMPVLMSGARALAFPSLYEGFGLPVLEAQACGTPVVCSMTSSLPEAAGDGALFVDPCDVDAIAAALQRALDDNVVRGNLVANGFRNLGRFSWEASASVLFHLIAELGE